MGMIVMMDDSGNLSINYLGTDPSAHTIPTMEHKEVNYAELEAEHNKMQALIRQIQQQGKKEPKDKVLLQIPQVPLQCDMVQPLVSVLTCFIGYKQ